MIPEFKEKVNHFYGEQKREIFFITSFFLIGMIGFGLGRVSILAPHKTPIRIIEGPPSVASSPNREYPTETQILAPKGVKIVASKNGTAYYLTWNGSKWATSTSNVFLDGKFERKVTVANVQRDNTSQDIVLSGGTVDANTKLVTMTVAWSTTPGATTTKTISAYFTNLFN